MINIRRIKEADYDMVWEFLEKIIAGGDVFANSPHTTKEEMKRYWCHPEKHTYVAEIDGEIAGSFFIQNNQSGLGSHIANAGYAVSPSFSGKGVGTAMGVFSLEEASRLGYKAMQFNLVVKSNVHAVKLWQKLGFEIVGEIPEAFQHSKNGLTNAYIMYRKL